MKKIIIIPIFILPMFFAFSQNRQAMLDSIVSSDAPCGAVNYAIENNIAEALPIIEQAYWRTKNITSKSECLDAMLYFHSPNLHSFARAAYDSAQYYAYHESDIFNSDNRSPRIQYSDSLQVMVMATHFLILSGDYSTVQCIFDILRRDRAKSYINGDALISLKDIALHIPQYADSAKAELRRIIKEVPLKLDRWRALIDFVEVYGKDAFPEILYVEMNDKDQTGGNNATAFSYLFELDYPDLHNFLRQRLSTDSWSSARAIIADSLLLHYGAPEDYEFVRQYMSHEPDQVARHSMEYAIKSFKPPKPADSNSVSSLIDKLIQTLSQCLSQNWLGNMTYTNELSTYLSEAKTNILNGNQIGCARQIRTFQQKVDQVYHDSTASRFVTLEGWKFLYYNAQYILDRLPQIPPSGCNVKLINSSGTKLTTGALQYYEGSWKDAVNNNDGTFTVTTTAKTLSLRMTYEYGTQTKSNVTVGYDTVAFQTVNAQIQLQNSNGILIDTGSVQYYAGAWRNLGTTINGIATKELLPNTYSFRMTYAYASKDKQQDIGNNPIVVFQTVNAVVQLQNSQGTLIDTGTVQYYSGAWRDLGVTTNGVANKELLPNNYSFRMTYAYASKDKQQDISTNATVVFQTVNASVQLQNSQGALIDQGTVQYYSGAWRDLGTTTNGIANKELLPNSYSFRMTYAYASKDKQQDISTNAIVVFQTVNATVQLQNSQGALIDQGTVQYYSGAWRDFGATLNGVTNKELLPNNYSFRMSYAFASKDKQQDISTNATVVFQTVNAAVQLQNSQGVLIDQGTVQYYSGAWRTLGTTTNGTAAKELLPNNYSFRMTYEYVSIDKAQDITTNNTVSFSTVLCTIRVKNSQNQLVNNAMASYYSGAWRQIGNTINGVITKELFPVNLSFRVKYGTQQQDKQQNLSTNTMVEFAIQ
jgi:formylmethanofuran dehydrogenase subunit C